MNIPGATARAHGLTRRGESEKLLLGDLIHAVEHRAVPLSYSLYIA